MSARRLLLLAALAGWLPLAAAELPAYFRQALAGFAGETPRGWAYTLTTQKGTETSVERYDPAQPADRRWTLLQHNGRPATDEQARRYRSYKTTHTPETVRATFARGDLDLGAVRLLREDAERADFLCPFRPDLSDGTLANLEVVLTASKTTPHIERYELRLREEFSPVFSVKVLALNVTVTFAPPAADRPALPRTSRSQFRGRLFFLKTIEEDLRISYSDFTRTGGPAAPQD